MEVEERRSVMGRRWRDGMERNRGKTATGEVWTKGVHQSLKIEPQKKLSFPFFRRDIPLSVQEKST